MQKKAGENGNLISEEPKCWKQISFTKIKYSAAKTRLLESQFCSWPTITGTKLHL